jgi:hypothetical protein
MKQTRARAKFGRIPLFLRLQNTRMKTIYGLTGSVLIVFYLIGASNTITSCTKTVTEYDTTVVHDTVCDCVSGLVAYYNFTSGTLADSSGYGNNISFNNATKAPDRNGVADNAYSFNGTNSYMVVPNEASLNPTNITLFAIVKVNAFYSGACRATNILMKGNQDPVQGFYSLRTHDAVNDCAAPFQANTQRFLGAFGNNIPEGSGAGVMDPTAVQTGTWYKLAYTYDGRKARLYVNGMLVSELTRTVSFTPNTSNIYIGKTENPTFPYYLNGVIDEIRIYNHALSECAVKALSKK